MSKYHPHLSHPKYRADIDGLRAIAVLFVVFFHAFPNWVKGGFVGVDVFFVISGYLISTIIFENLGKNTFSFAEFYARRVKRIFPALLLVLCASYVFGWFVLFPEEYKQLGKHIAGGAGLISNFILWREAGYFDNAAETKPLLHLWSLGVEEQFYIVWPLLLWLAWRRRFNPLAITIFIILVSFYLNVKGVHEDKIGAFYSPQTRFWELLCGSLLAWVKLYKNGAFESFRNRLNDRLISFICLKKPEVDSSKSANVVSFIGFFLLIFGFRRIHSDFNLPGFWVLIPILGTLLIISAGPDAWVNRKVLSNRIVIWFGLISYPLYLWHWPLLSYARIVQSEVPGISIRITAVLVSIVLAWLTYKFIETPVRKGRDSKTKMVVLVCLMLVMGSVGYSTYVSEGYASRSFIKHYKNNQDELVRTPATDNACLTYIGSRSPSFDYCRFTDMGSAETIAVIGDSHAHVAYTGISEILKAKKINTVLMANKSCPPLLGAATGWSESDTQFCERRINEIIKQLLAHKDINKVFFFTRGPIYLTGTEPASDINYGVILTEDEFRQGIRRTIEKLSKNGKKVFYITENPELSSSAESCMIRPLRLVAKDCRPGREAVLQRQKRYLEIVRALPDVTVIDALNAFCDSDKCAVFDSNGLLLYADDDHLSIAGSRFQANRLLKNFLN